MVHRVERGGNYGWAAMEGPQPIKPEKTVRCQLLPPLIALPHTLGGQRDGWLRLSRPQVAGARRSLHLWRLGNAAAVGGTV